jgi:uncharacterized protein (TIGR00297 family)
MSEQLVTGFLLAAIIAALAFWRGSLSRSGAFGALIVGTVTFGIGGWQWGVLLALFFATSSLFSHLKLDEKRAAAEKFDKGHKRDIGQVVANGGLGTLIALFSVVWPSDLWFVSFVGVMAAVTADTWATELGTLSRKPPRLITNGRAVEVGTSGAVSLLGTVVSFAGALFIGLVAGMLGRHSLARLAAAGAVAGLAGSLFDSLLGATVQRIYYCDVCQKETESKRHKCGRPTRPLRGWAWLNNDLVNLWASLIGGLVATGQYFLTTA